MTCARSDASSAPGDRTHANAAHRHHVCTLPVIDGAVLRAAPARQMRASPVIRPPELPSSLESLSATRAARKRERTAEEATELLAVEPATCVPAWAHEHRCNARRPTTCHVVGAPAHRTHGQAAPGGNEQGECVPTVLRCGQNAHPLRIHHNWFRSKTRRAAEAELPWEQLVSTIRARDTRRMLNGATSHPLSKPKSQTTSERNDRARRRRRTRQRRARAPERVSELSSEQVCAREELQPIAS